MISYRIYAWYLARISGDGVSLVRACKSDPKTFAEKKLIEVSSWFKHRGRRAIDFTPGSEGSEASSIPPLSRGFVPILPSTRLELTLRWNCRATSRVPSYPFSTQKLVTSTMAHPCISGIRFYVGLRKVSPSPFPSARDGDSEIFEETKMNSAADRSRGWEGRANRSRLGLFASYRVRVKINVNFAVELISPAPINSTNSLSPSHPPSSVSLFVRLSISRSLRVSLYLFLFPCLAFPTDAPLRTFLSSYGPNLPQGFPKLENFRGEKKHRVSVAFGKKLPSFRASFPGAFSAGIRALFVAITYAK